MTHDALRGTGRTTDQIRAAPQGALFIWCGHDTHYPRMLAQREGRQDLLIVSRSALSTNSERHRGAEYPAVVLDHWITECGMNVREMEAWEMLRTRVRT
jgi:hypothetical protein